MHHTSHSPDAEIDGDVYVSPRYLAGTIGIGDPALDPLRALGWDLHHDELANAFLTAPDHTVCLGFLPEGPDEGLWRINAYDNPFDPPAWGVCFNDSCPTEFVTAFTTALAHAYQQGPSTFLAKPDTNDPELNAFNAIAPLVNRGWKIEYPRWGVLALHAPDGLATLEYTTDSLDPQAELTTREARWHLWAGTSIDRPAWYATASTDTPVALVKAVTECVSDPAPLPRWRQDTHSYVRDLATLTPILPPVPTPLDVQRTAAATRRPAAAAAAATSVPRWSTTSRTTYPRPRR
ncbi:DUF317 domain-containing protein [Streptomyces sp. DSM 42041]|uniref:DUF317 domain-containing protein n=1 Tax=Streptomyces hazeniae TaxID=3075538 RepID=A0ABU2NZ95_9ACTN|nr:DUF317 domain-containing protein [Streptomyces sp. DSM 42041]MDT0382301.1 DUF317 domain-containing protein [Streptomyces sp. DSM 42041]